jgi:hypothetical protein
MNMNKYFLAFTFLLFAAVGVFAQQQTFLLKGESKKYDLKVVLDSCSTSEDICNDKGKVLVMRKNQTEPFQTIEMEEMYLTLDTGKTLDGKPVELDKDELYGVSFYDYNFDGAEDLIVSNGNYKPYGGISSNVYLFTKGKFVKHTGLSELETEYMTVEVDRKRRIIEAFVKSGCCFHETTRYRLVGNKLVKIYVYTEEWQDSETATATTETLVGKKWRRKSKTIKSKVN